MPVVEQEAAASLVQVRYVLKNLSRDWAEEGAFERAQSYGRIVSEVKELFADW